MSPRSALATESKTPPGARTHDGFYLRGGVSFGRTWLSYDAPMNTGAQHEGSAFGGASGAELQAGFSLPFGFVVGGTLFGHLQGELDFENPDVGKGWDSSSTGISGVGAFARLYPLATGGFHAEAIVALARHGTRHEVTVIEGVPRACPIVVVSCAFPETRTIVLVESAWGYELGIGAGYGFWFANQWSFDLLARMQLAHTYRGTRSYWFWMPTLGAGITFH